MRILGYVVRFDLKRKMVILLSNWLLPPPPYSHVFSNLYSICSMCFCITVVLIQMFVLYLLFVHVTDVGVA